MDDLTSPPETLAALLAAEKQMLREQFAAAWQLQLDSVLERLDSGWRELADGTLERRFAALEARVSGRLEQLSEEKAAEREHRAQAQLRRSLTGQLSQAARRIEQAADSATWAAALLDGAQLYAPQVLLLELAGETARAAAARTGGSALAWTSARPWPMLVQSAVDSQDTVVALACAEELGAGLHEAIAPPDESRAVAVPVIVGRGEPRTRVAAVLIGIGAGSDFDAAGLELLATMAGTALDCRLAAQRAVTAAPAGALMSIAPSSPAPAAPSEPAPWREEELQARALRFARVKVAEMRLYQPEAVLRGRASADIYSALQAEIDRSREEYQQQFGSAALPADYFHEEIVRTLAHEDASLLGPGYPGPRV